MTMPSRCRQARRSPGGTEDVPAMAAPERPDITKLTKAE